MHTEARTFRRGLWLSFGLLVGGACSSSPDAPARSSTFNQAVAALGAWNGGFRDTTAVPDTVAQSVLTASNGDNWVCQNVEFDDKRNLDQMLTPGLTAGVMWPGALIQGQGLKAGDPAGIPLPRSPITISIDLAVDSPSVRIDVPTSASVQSAIAGLQRQADVRLGNVDVVPALIDYQKTEAFSDQQASVDVGIHGAFPVKGVNISVGVTVRDSSSFQQHTIAVTLIQPMYTISFADEEKVDPGAYLADSATPAEVQDVVNRGMIGPNNQPVYVKSVTYGRMLVFTLTNDSSASALDIEAAIGASVAAFKASTNDSVAIKNRQILQNTELHVQAFGGSQDSALAAIRSDSLDKFFTAVSATQAVPLSYRVNYLRDGTVALLGAEASYTKSDCAPAGTNARFWTLKFDSLTSTGSCPGTQYSDSASIVVPNGQAYILSPDTFALLAQSLVPMRDTTVTKEVVFPLRNASGPGFTVKSVFTDASCGTIPCQLSRDFSPTDTFSTGTYHFTQFISLPGRETGCVANFFWEVSTQPVLAPPARSSGW